MDKQFTREFWSKMQCLRLNRIAEHLRDAFFWWKT